jgi:hypothetical protein
MKVEYYQKELFAKLEKHGHVKMDFLGYGVATVKELRKIAN